MEIAALIISMLAFALAFFSLLTSWANSKADAEMFTDLVDKPFYDADLPPDLLQEISTIIESARKTGAVVQVTKVPKGECNCPACIAERSGTEEMH